MFSYSFISRMVSELGECEGVLDVDKGTQSYNRVWNSGVKRTEVSTVEKHEKVV